MKTTAINILFLQAAVFHPLSTLHWEECGLLPTMLNPQCIVLGDMLYIGGVPGYSAALFKSPIHPIEWRPLSTPTQGYALTNYQSQLVLVGGLEETTKEITNKLWASDDGSNWKESLPPMPTKRDSSSAVNINSTTEYLVVAGGREADYLPVGAVEVLNGSTLQWWTAEHLPKMSFCMKSTLHEGKWYLMGGVQQCRDVYYCDIKSLVDGVSPLWSQFQVPFSADYFCSASFRGCLICIGEYNRHSKIVAFSSPQSHLWTHIGRAPFILDSAVATVLPSGDLVVAGGRKLDYSPSAVGNNKVFKVSLKGKVSLKRKTQLQYKQVCLLEVSAQLQKTQRLILRWRDSTMAKVSLQVAISMCACMVSSTGDTVHSFAYQL